MSTNPSTGRSPTPIVIQLDLAKDSRKDKCLFYALANRENGYEIQMGTVFSASNKNGHGCTTVTITVNPENYFSFRVHHPLLETSFVCAALNVVTAPSVGAKVKVTVSDDGQRAIFTIMPKSKALEEATKQQLNAVLSSLPPKTVS